MPTVFTPIPMLSTLPTNLRVLAYCLQDATTMYWVAVVTAYVLPAQKDGSSLSGCPRVSLIRISFWRTVVSFLAPNTMTLSHIYPFLERL